MALATSSINREPQTPAKVAALEQALQHFLLQQRQMVPIGRGASRVETRGSLADVSHIKVQAPLPEIADELCAVAQEVKAAPSDIHLGAQATEREVRREIASPYFPAL